MSQYDYIKEIAKYGLENDQDRLLSVLNDLIDYSKKQKKINFALQLQSILKEGLKLQKATGITKLGSESYLVNKENQEFNDLIIEKLTSDYNFDNLICSPSVEEELHFFVKEHLSVNILRNLELPVSNKVLFYGPSGCGKTLASYVLAGELEKMMYVINLGSVVSSKLGETSKNLLKVFRKAASENCIIFLDEFDSLGKLRDYDQDHGEMKRVVNTILQLFDYLPQESIIIAATNQIDLIDKALTRRFDLKINLNLPDKKQIEKLIDKTIEQTPFKIRKTQKLNKLTSDLEGMSYYSIRKTLINAIKRTIFEVDNKSKYINLSIWESLIKKEKLA
jgi:AAA+ superfamily predicted ATPase